MIALLVGHDAPTGRIAHTDVDIRARGVEDIVSPLPAGIVVMVEGELPPKPVIEPRMDGAYVDRWRRWRRGTIGGLGPTGLRAVSLSHPARPASARQRQRERNVLAMCVSVLAGTVKFSGSVADLVNETRHAKLPRIPLSPRDHQPRRLAVSPLRCELSRCRRSSGPTRHHGVLRSDPAVVPHGRFSIRSPAQASTGPTGRHLAPGRGLRHHPGTAALSSGVPSIKMATSSIFSSSRVATARLPNTFFASC